MNPACPACGSVGEHDQEDQFQCTDSTCRVTLFEDYGQTGWRP